MAKQVGNKLDWADEYLTLLRHTPDQPTLHSWGGKWWWYRENRWAEQPTFRSDLLAWLASMGYTDNLRDCKDVEALLVSRVGVRAGGLPCWEPPDPSRTNQWLATANGIIHPEGISRGDPDAVIPATSRWFSPVTLPYGYEEGATCPTWEAYLRDTFEDDNAKIHLLQEFCGYLLTPNISRQKLLMFVGEGATGKSVAANTIRALLGGSDFVGAFRVRQLQDTYTTASLSGKLLNISEEAGTEMWPSLEENIKALVESGITSTRRMYSMPGQEFLYTRLLFLSNHWPDWSDSSTGLWRRILCIPFRRIVPEGQRDVRLLDKLTLELPGILNWAIEGLARLNHQDGWTDVADARAELAAEAEGRRTISEFLRDRTRYRHDAVTSRADLVRAYRGWCVTHGFQAPRKISWMQLRPHVSALYPAAVMDHRCDDLHKTMSVKHVALLTVAAEEQPSESEPECVAT